MNRKNVKSLVWITCLIVMWISIFLCVRKLINDNDQMKKFFSGWECEKQMPVASLCNDNLIIIDEKEIRVDKVLPDLEAVCMLAVSDQMLYFVHTEESQDGFWWILSTSDYSGGKLTELGRITSDTYQVANTTEDIYLEGFQWENGAYYYERKLIICSAEEVLEYDLQTGSVKSYHETEYHFPKLTPSVVLRKSYLWYEDSRNNFRKKHLFADLANENKYLHAVAEKANREKYGDYLFSRAYVYENELYLVASVNGWQGIHAVIFCCDINTGDISYISHAPAVEKIVFDYHLIPVVSSKS